MHTKSIVAVCALALAPVHAASPSTPTSPDVRLVPRRPRPTEERKRAASVPQLVVVDEGQEWPLSRRNNKEDGQRARKRAAPGNETGIIQHLTTEANVYIVNLTLGTPPITYPFQLDTASSDLLIASSLCTSTSCPDLASTPRYNPGRSSSFSSINSNTTGFNLTYSDGSQASGFLGLETLTIAGTSSGGQVTVPQQVVGIVNQTTLDFAALGVSGIVGLGFPRLSALLRASLKEATDEPTTTTTTAIRGGYTSQSSQISSRTAESTSTTEFFFSILPIETITPLTSIPTTFPTSTSTSLVRRATAATAAEETDYYPPLLESLFGHPSISSSPHLAYPIFSIALANTSAPYSAANDAASLTWGGVSSAYVSATAGNSSFAGRTVEDVDWVEVVRFERATTLSTNTTARENSSGRFDLSSLEDEAYLYWSIPLLGVSLNGTALALEPTYNASFTGIKEPIALLDIGTNGIYAPQEAVISLFAQIKDARQVSDGQWAVPCATRSTMTFLLGPKTLVELQPSEWMYARVGGGSSMCLAWPVVAPPSADGVDWQLGTPVLRKVYSIFSYGIDGVQPPLMGFLPLPSPGAANASASSAAVNTSTITSTSTVSRNLSDPTPTSVQNVAEISSLITSTIATVLPNALLPDPSHTTPPYAFLTTGAVPTLGQVQSNGLANPLIYSINDVPVVTASFSGSSGTGSSMNTQTGTAGASASAQTNGASGGGSTGAATSAGRRRVPEVWVSIGTSIGLAGLAGCLLLAGRL